MDDNRKLLKVKSKRYSRIYIQVYEYEGEFYVDRSNANLSMEHRTYLSDILVSPKIISLKKVLRENRLKNLLERWYNLF